MQSNDQGVSAEHDAHGSRLVSGPLLLERGCCFSNLFRHRECRISHRNLSGGDTAKQVHFATFMPQDVRAIVLLFRSIFVELRGILELLLRRIRQPLGL